ncbi:hypothetical protein GJAV_G00062680 [Gymnothorax javanicus]|nr:hypothetical protein GJAV_G00062680 [Gymnothorax javanicus]
MAFRGHRIFLHEDVSAELGCKQAAFKEVKALLYAKKVRFRMVYPARLRVSFDNTELCFDPPGKAMNFHPHWLVTVRICENLYKKVSTAKKLRLITGLNGGVVTGVNPGLLVGGVQPALLGAGLGVQPALIGGGLGVQPVLGGGLIAQPQVIPGLPYMVPPQPMVPFNPNLGAQQQQGGMQPNGGVNAFGAQMGANQFGAQMGANQLQPQGAPGGIGNFNPQQGPALPGPLRRIKRSSLRVACTERPSIDSEISTQITPTPTAADDSTAIPNTA